MATLLAIDPGTTNTGIAILSVNEEGIITLVHVETICTTYLLNFYKDVEHLYGLRHAKITAICDRLYQLITIYNPYEIICEDSYFNPDTPQAKFALLELIASIRSLLYTHFYSLPLVLVEASLVKKTLQVKGNSGDKTLVKNALEKLPLSCGVGITLQLYDEHSCDAIAIGYSRLLLS